jgi:hypothetical protein
MLATFSRELCYMRHNILKIGEKFKFDHGYSLLWNGGLHLNSEIGQVCPIILGLLY